MFRLRPHISSTTIDNRRVLLDESTGRYWELNQTGSRMLELLLSVDSVDDVAEKVSRTEGIEFSRAQKDVHSFIHSLLTAQVVGEARNWKAHEPQEPSLDE